jgi:hypothetical protein
MHTVVAIAWGELDIGDAGIEGMSWIHREMRRPVELDVRPHGPKIPPARERLSCLDLEGRNRHRAPPSVLACNAALDRRTKSNLWRCPKPTELAGPQFSDSGVALAKLAVQPSAAKAVDYNYAAPQVAPPVANDLGMTDLAAILNETAPNRPYLVGFQLTTTDASGTKAGAAPLKVVPTDDPAHPYLGVFHSPINTAQFATYFAYSSNLSAWHTLGQIHSPASQPDMRILRTTASFTRKNTTRPAGPLSEYNYGNACRPSGAHSEPGCRAHHGNDDGGNAAGQGRRDSRRISYDGAIANSTAEINQHYYNLGQHDLDAIGTLANSRTGRAPPIPSSTTS